MTNQTESKRGGARNGAGRKPKDLQVWMTARGVSPLTAAEVLANADERKKWHRILNSEDDRVLLQAMMFLVSMRDGKPAQNINVTSRNLNLNVKDVETARAIVAEIKRERNDSVALTERNRNANEMLTSGGSPLLVDAPGGAVLAEGNSEGEAKENEERMAKILRNYAFRGRRGWFSWVGVGWVVLLCPKNFFSWQAINLTS